MDFVFKSTLRHMAMVKIVVHLWIQNDVESFLHPDDRDFSTTFPWLMEKVENLGLPFCLKNELLSFIKPIGSNIYAWYSWYRYNYPQCPNKDNLGQYDLSLRLNPKQLCWNLEGTLDWKKNARLIVLDASVDLASRYKLACIYCLEEEILLLYERLHQKPEDLLNKNIFRGVVRYEHQHLIIFWNYYAEGRIDDFEHLYINVSENVNNFSANYYLFHRAVASNNDAAVKCFFKKLTSYEKASVISNPKQALGKYYGAEIARFLLSSINEDQRLEVMRTYPEVALTSLLSFPYQSMFLQTANRLWEYLGENGFSSLLDAIFSHINHAHRGCFYRDIFREFWQSSPDRFKRNIFNHESLPWHKLFYFWREGNEDEEICRLMLNDATADEKKQILYRPNEWATSNPEIRKQELELPQVYHVYEPYVRIVSVFI